MKALCKAYKAMQVRKVMLATIKWPQMCSCKKGLETEHEIELQQSKDMVAICWAQLSKLPSPE